jgi:hypothetical protein
VVEAMIQAHATFNSAHHQRPSTNGFPHHLRLSSEVRQIIVDDDLLPDLRTRTCRGRRERWASKFQIANAEASI